MKVRVCVLVACMIVVPGLAMFSHHIPAELRQAARCHLWQPVANWLRPSASTGGRVAVVEPSTVQATPEAAATAPPGSPAAIDRLVALGAMAIDVRPLEGVSGVHVASCRVAMDAAGQLHRVFQAPGPGPGEATAALADQVAAWRDRIASHTTAADPTPGAL